MKRFEFVSLGFWIFGPNFFDVGFEFVAARRHIYSVRQFDCRFAVAVLGFGNQIIVAIKWKNAPRATSHYDRIPGEFTDPFLLHLITHHVTDF